MSTLRHLPSCYPCPARLGERVESNLARERTLGPGIWRPGKSYSCQALYKSGNGGSTWTASCPSAELCDHLSICTFALQRPRASSFGSHPGYLRTACTFKTMPVPGAPTGLLLRRGPGLSILTKFPRDSDAGPTHRFPFLQVPHCPILQLVTTYTDVQTYRNLS